MKPRCTKFQLMRANRKKRQEGMRRCKCDPGWCKQEEEIFAEPDSRIMYERLIDRDPRADIPSWGELLRRVGRRIVAALSVPNMERQ